MALTNIVSGAPSWCEICTDVEDQGESGQGQSQGQGRPPSYDTLATMYCRNCGQRLCDRCGSWHTKQRFAADHEVVKLCQVSPNISDDNATQDPTDYWSLTCPKHHSRSLEVYCKTCDEIGCLSCLSLDAHLGHKWCDVKEECLERGGSLSRILEQISAKLEECRGALDKQRRAADVFQQSILEARQQLRTEVEKLDLDIHRCVEELQCKLEAAADRKTQMETRCLKLEEQSSKLSTFVEQCQKVIDATPEVEALRSSRELGIKAAEMVDTKIEDDLCLNLRVVFNPTNLGQYLPQLDVNLVGSVSVDHVEAVDHLEVQTGEEDDTRSFIVANRQPKDVMLHRDPVHRDEVSRMQVRSLKTLFSKLLPRPPVTPSKLTSDTNKTSHQISRQSSKLQPEMWFGWVSQSSRNFRREVVGIASLAGELYILLKGDKSVLVMDSRTFDTRRNIALSSDMLSPARDIAAGVGKLYVIDDDSELYVLRVDTGRWSKSDLQVHDRAWSISTSRTGEVLITSRSSRLLLECTPGGSLQRKIRLAADVVNPNHAKRVSSEMLVVCHGDMMDEVQRICTVNNDGQVLNSCSVDRQPSPSHLTVVDGRQVYVAFRKSEQVLSFDLHTMQMIDRVVASRNHGLQAPSRLDFCDNVLFVAGDKIVKAFRSY